MTRSKLKAIEHMEKIEKPRRFDTKAFCAQFSPRIESHKEVLKVRKLAIGYDKVLSTVSFDLLKGQKVAVIGENGKGKSTLLKTLVEQIAALGGTFQYGIDVEMGYFEQQMAQYTSEETVLDDFWNEYPTLKQTEIRTALGHFLFSGDDVFKKISQLSGGEKVRLSLLKIFMRKPNLLILDEPTNHMDMVGKQALEKMLTTYTGTVLFVSHDRYFIKEVATAMLVFEEERVQYYPCGYEEYQELKGGKLAESTKSLIHDKTINKEKTSVVSKLETKSQENISQDVNLGDMESQGVEANGVKSKFYNPGKEEAKRKRQIEKLKDKITLCEQNIEEWKKESLNEAIASDYKKLEEIMSQINEKELEWETLMMELEELESM